MGHTVSGSDLKDSAGARPAAGRRASPSHVGHDAANLGDADLVAVSTAIPERNPELAAARERGLRGRVAGPRSSPPSPPPAAPPRCRAPTARRRPRRCSPWPRSPAGSARASSSAASSTRSAAASCGTTREWFVVEADESDGTFVELPAEAVVVTNVEADHLDRYGDARRHHRRLRPLPRPGDRPAHRVRRRAQRRSRLGRRHGATTYGTHPDADCRIVDPVPERVGVRVPPRASTATTSARSRLPVPGLHNARNATAALAAAAAIGADLDAARGGPRPLRRRRPPLPVPGRGRRRHRRRRLRPQPRQGGGRAGRGPGRRLAPGRRACSSPTATRRTATLWREFGPSFADADVVVLTDVYAADEPPIPGVTGKLLVDSALDAHPWKRVAWLPAARRRASRYLAAELRARRPVPHCRRRRRHDVARRPPRRRRGRRAGDDPGGDRSTRASLLREAVGDRLRRRRAARPAHHLPRRRAGRPARSRRRRSPTCRAVATPSAAPACAVLVVGKGSNLLVADAGFAGLAVVLGEGFAARRRRRAPPCAAGGAAALPVVARRTVAAGLTGFEWAVGVPGSIGGAVRMNAGGHGSDMAATPRGVRVVDLAGGEDGEVPAAALDLGYRRSALGRVDGRGRGHPRPRARRPRRAARPTLAEIVRWRREQPARRPERRLGVHQPAGRLGRPPHRRRRAAKGLRLGTAEVSTKHANFIQADAGGRADDVHALMVEVRRRVADALRRRPAPRDRPRRLRRQPSSRGRGLSDRRRRVGARDRLRSGRRGPPAPRRPGAGPAAPDQTPPAGSAAVEARSSTPASPPAASRCGATRAAAGCAGCLAALALAGVVAVAALVATRTPLLDVDHVARRRAPTPRCASDGHRCGRGAGAGTRRRRCSTSTCAPVAAGRSRRCRGVAGRRSTRQWPGTLAVAVVERAPVAGRSPMAGGAPSSAADGVVVAVVADRRGRRLVGARRRRPCRRTPATGVDAAELLAVAAALPAEARAPRSPPSRAGDGDGRGRAPPRRRWRSPASAPPTDLAAKLVAVATVLEPGRPRRASRRSTCGCRRRRP